MADHVNPVLSYGQGIKIPVNEIMDTRSWESYSRYAWRGGMVTNRGIITVIIFMPVVNNQLSNNAFTYDALVKIVILLI